jgi:GNAT superfamily N-acetyltransferase
MAEIRQMVPEDLPSVRVLTSAAFGALHGERTQPPEDDSMFPALFFATRLAADPAGCFVAAAEQAPSRLAGALFSVARGTLGWFGPLAVDPGAQRSGTGAALVAQAMRSWRARGVRLMGLETFGDSAFHVRFYGKFGFRPAWTGVSFTRQLRGTAMPGNVHIGNGHPDLGFIYPGLDVSAEAAATTSYGAGTVISTEDGLAILHLRPTFQDPGTGFVPFLAAASRESFSKLMDAAEHLTEREGHESLLVRTPGSSTGTIDALTERGYRAGRVMVRMKAGENPDYDKDAAYYIDNWL